jgi:hypothetical protein
MMPLEQYDVEKLKKSLLEITDVLYELNSKGSKLLVKNINGCFIRQKFQSFGEADFFISPEGKIYYHPSFYYNQDSRGILCDVKDFKKDELNTHFTQPHLICINCETFYCDRNIYANKINTGEFKVPSENSCATATLFSEFSRSYFNKLNQVQLLDPKENLDKIEVFESEKYYKKTNNCLVNKVKKINFFERELFRNDNEKM